MGGTVPARIEADGFSAAGKRTYNSVCNVFFQKGSKTKKKYLFLKKVGI